MRTTLITLALATALTGCIEPDDAPTTETTQAVTSWGGWRRVPGNTNVSLATVTLGGRLYAFDKALDNSIQMMTFTRSTGWSAPRAVGGTTDAALAATVCWDGIYLFQKGADRHVYMTSSYDGTYWPGWIEVPGGGQTDAAVNAVCPSKGDQGLRVYMKGLDGHVYENTRSMTISPVKWTGWSGWHEVGDGWVTNAPLGSFEVDPGYGDVVLLFKGLNNHSYWKRFHAAGYYTTSGTWTAWREIGGTTDVALAGAGGMIMAKGINDQAGYYQTYNAASDSWPGWAALGVGTTNAAYAISQYNGGPTSLAFGYYVFAKGINDNGIYFQSTAPLDPPAPPPPPPVTPGPITSTTTTFMTQQSNAGDGVPIAWWDSFGVGIPSGTLQSITNLGTNNFNIYLVRAGHFSSECQDPNAVITLGPGQTTSNMTSLYGTASPALPIPIVACAGAAGVTVPSVFLISVTYRHQ
jgi:hypothetical protein